MLKLAYVKSKDNPAKFPSRELKKIDTCLIEATWHRVQEKFGNKHGHSIDFKALDSNCMQHKDGRMLSCSLYNTVITLNIGTPRPATAVVLNIKQFNFTLK